MSVNRHGGEIASGDVVDGLGVVEASGWRRVPGGWVETDERAAACVFHADRLLADGDLPFCAGCKARMVNHHGGHT